MTPREAGREGEGAEPITLLAAPGLRAVASRDISHTLCPLPAERPEGQGLEEPVAVSGSAWEFQGLCHLRVLTICSIAGASNARMHRKWETPAPAQ